MKEKWDIQRRDLPIKSKITISRALLEAERLWTSHSVCGSLFCLTSFSLFLAESTHKFTALVILDLSSDSADIVSDIMLTTECFTLSWTVIWNLSANPELNIWHCGRCPFLVCFEAMSLSVEKENEHLHSWNTHWKYVANVCTLRLWHSNSSIQASFL